MLSDLEIPEFLKRKKGESKIILHDSDEQCYIKNPVSPEEARQRMIERGDLEAPKETISKPTLSIQERTRQAGMSLYYDIDLMFESGVWLGDSWTEDSSQIYDHLVKGDFSATVVNHALEQCRGFHDELLSAETDEDLKYAYNNVSKKDLKRYQKFWESACTTLERYAANYQRAKPVVTRKRKVSVQKKVKGFKYCEKFDDLQLMSISPQKLVGAVQVWLYNTKNQTLTHLEARNSTGIDISGQTFKNIDEYKSETKRIGRKTEEVLKNILKEGKRNCKKVFDDISAKPIEVQTRSNVNTVLLRCF